jgi:hypothetical protein
MDPGLTHAEGHETRWRGLQAIKINLVGVLRKLDFVIGLGLCNTRGVCHQLSSGFELKHDRLSGDEDVKVNLWTGAPT